MALSVPDATSYAGARLSHLPPTLPATEPGFDFRSTVDSASSGGSPRLVLAFSSGDDAQLRPLSWTAGVWTTVGGVTGTANFWDNHGVGTSRCGPRYDVDYATIQGCHSSESVVSAYVVTDSGWVTAPYTHYIDNITYGGVTISQPSKKT